MNEFDPVAWCLAYRLVYGMDEFIQLFQLLYETEDMRPDEAAYIIRGRISKHAYRRAVNIALAIEESCRKMNLDEDVRPGGLYYFWQRKREVFKYPQWEP